MAALGLGAVFPDDTVGEAWPDVVQLAHHKCGCSGVDGHALQRITEAAGEKLPLSVSQSHRHPSRLAVYGLQQSGEAHGT